ncbi:MAG: acylphosphatase [Ruminococcus sp.]|nr:acylphosphatase [Ruminococcus sp.]
MEKIRRHIIFYGCVQGVGFRWKAKHTAVRYGISGWVRNLDDGSVEMEAEGTPRDIDDLTETLRNHSWGSVERTEERDIPVHGDYSFEVR